jgi:hypothetical protein
VDVYAVGCICCCVREMRRLPTVRRNEVAVDVVAWVEQYDCGACIVYSVM